MESVVKFFLGKSDAEERHEMCVRNVREHISFTCHEKPTTTRALRFEVAPRMDSGDLLTVSFLTTDRKLLCRGRNMNEVNKFIQEMLPNSEGKMHVIFNETPFSIEHITGPVIILWAKEVKTWNNLKEEVLFSNCPIIVAYADEECREQSRVAVLRDSRKQRVALCKKSEYVIRDPITKIERQYYRWFQPANCSVVFQSGADIKSYFPVRMPGHRRKQRKSMLVQAINGDKKTRGAGIGATMGYGSSVSIHPSEFSTASTSDLPRGNPARARIEYVTGRKLEALGELEETTEGEKSDSSAASYSYHHEQSSPTPHRSHFELGVSESELSSIEPLASPPFPVTREKELSACDLADGGSPEAQNVSPIDESGDGAGCSPPEYAVESTFRIGPEEAVSPSFSPIDEELESITRESLKVHTPYRSQPRSPASSCSDDDESKTELDEVSLNEV